MCIKPIDLYLLAIYFGLAEFPRTQKIHFGWKKKNYKKTKIQNRLKIEYKFYSQVKNVSQEIY